VIERSTPLRSLKPRSGANAAWPPFGDRMPTS